MGAGKGPRWSARARPLEWRDLKLVQRREGPGGLRDPSSGSAVTSEGRRKELRWAQGGDPAGVGRLAATPPCAPPYARWISNSTSSQNWWSTS